jgi:outer membrane lipoprotein-sorting protein
MKKLVLFLPCLLILARAEAQDTKARTILDGVCQKTKSYTTIEIEFSYTMENKKASVHETKTGSATMKAEKYWLSFAGQTIISDGKTQWTYIKDNNEVQVNNVDPNDDQSMNPSKLLTSYDKSFTPKFIKEEARDGKNLQILDLTPIKGRSYYRIRVEIDKTQKQIVNSIVYDKNGTTTYTYSVTKFTPNKTIPDSKFAFDVNDPKYKGVEVIDMR